MNYNSNDDGRELYIVEVSDYGWEIPCYFQGHGTSMTRYEDCATGIGQSYHDALSDAFECLHQQGEWDSDELVRLETEERCNRTEELSKQNRPSPPDPTYTVVHSKWCGYVERERFEGLDDARQYVADRLRKLRRWYDVVTLSPGEEWECVDPDDAVTAGEDGGVIRLEEDDEQPIDDWYYHVGVSIRRMDAQERADYLDELEVAE